MVPNGWSKLSLKKLLTLNYGKSPKEIIDENGAYDIVGTGGITGSTNKYLHSEPSVIIGRKGTIDKPQYLDKPFWAIDTTFYCVPIDNNKVDIKWFYQYSKLINWRNYNEASGVPSLSRETIYAIQVATPPITEQREIVKILSTWDKAISTTERLIVNSTQQKKAVMQQLLTGKKRLLDESGKRFEGEWETQSIESLTNRVGDGIHSTPKYTDKSSIRFVNGNNLNNGSIVFSDLTKFVDEDDAKNHHRNLSSRTILMSINGTIGNLAIYNDENIVLGKSACYINVKEEVDVLFIFYKLASSEVQSHFISRLTGSTIKNLSLTTIKSTQVALPSLKEQQKIATVLTNADKEIELLEQQLADLQQEKKALMQVLLTGKKRVKLND